MGGKYMKIKNAQFLPTQLGSVTLRSYGRSSGFVVVPSNIDNNVWRSCRLSSSRTHTSSHVLFLSRMHRIMLCASSSSSSSTSSAVHTWRTAIFQRSQNKTRRITTTAATVLFVVARESHRVCVRMRLRVCACVLSSLVHPFVFDFDCVHACCSCSVSRHKSSVLGGHRCSPTPPSVSLFVRSQPCTLTLPYKHTRAGALVAIIQLCRAHRIFVVVCARFSSSSVRPPTPNCALRVSACVVVVACCCDVCICAPPADLLRCTYACVIACACVRVQPSSPFCVAGPSRTRLLRGIPVHNELLFVSIINRDGFVDHGASLLWSEMFHESSWSSPFVCPVHSNNLESRL